MKRRSVTVDQSKEQPSGRQESRQRSYVDPIVARLKARGLPVTRKNYVDLMFQGDEIPDPMPAELEQQIWFALHPPSIVDQRLALPLMVNDPILVKLKELGLPATRENLIKLAFPDGVPDEIPARRRRSPKRRKTKSK